MLTLVLAGLLAPAQITTPVVPILQPGPQVQVPLRPVRDLSGQVIGSEEDLDVALGGSFSAPFGPNITAVPTGDPRIWDLTFHRMGSGWEESVLIGIPTSHANPAPLLVAFHSYGHTPADILQNTTYFDEALNRGWFVVAPLGAHKFHFNVDYALENIRDVLDWFATIKPVDPDRIYGVGFSMGGGTALTYAARNLDPGHARFAAVVNHTGAASIRGVFDNSIDTSLLENSQMFGGTPTDFPNAYAAASTVDIDFVTARVNPSNDLARNLTHTSVTHWAVAGDPIGYLVDQVRIVHGQLYGRGTQSRMIIAIGNQHDWSTLNETAVLDLLATKQYANPEVGKVHRTLVTNNGFWFHFQVRQHTPGEFTPLRWFVDTPTNRLFVDRARNLKSIGFRPGSLGLDPAADLEVVVANTDGQSLELIVEGYALPPASVRRNGSSAANWTWDASAHTVTLYEASASGYPSWTIER
jgi:pimeloyl-ACP methyl ester carboxylesterase